MLSKKLAEQIQSIASSGYDELFVFNNEYVRAENPGVIEEALGIFQLIDMEPIAYQLGHKFYNVDRKAWFTCIRDQSLEQVKYRLGTYVLWMPTIDHMLQQATADEIRVALHPSLERHLGKYRTAVFDMRYPRYINRMNVSPAVYYTNDAWVAIAICLARAYKRRLDEFGSETISYPIYIEDKKMRLEPIVITDQSPF